MDPEGFKSVGELAALSSLGAVVYPLLAELDRDGLVERGWLEGDHEARMLAYRLAGDTGGSASVGGGPAEPPTKREG